MADYLGNTEVGGTLKVYGNAKFNGTLEGTLTGNASSATKLATARKTYVTLGTASTTTTRDWSGDTTIPVSGTLPVSNGGTGASSFTADSVIMSGATTTAALTTRAITNNTSASAVTGTTNLVTENTLKFYNGAYDASGNSNITKVGTISKGIWQGTAIAESYIASNAVTTAKIKDGNVTSAKLETISGLTATSYGDSGDQTPGYGSTFKVPYITVNAKGLVTGISEHTVKIPASDNTNTWRGIQDNLTSSTNTTDSLSAKQGYLLANGSARDSTKLPLSGGTLTGTDSVGINFTTKSTGNASITVYDTGNNYNKDVVFSSSGSMIIGGGEAASSIYTGNIDSIKGTENTAIAADGGVAIYTNCDTIANRKKFTFSTDGNLTATKFTGALDGNASTATTATDYAATGGIATALGNKASSTHTHGNISNTGTLATASKVVVTDANKTITVGTDAQTNAINSGITSTKVSTYDGYATTISNKANSSTAISSSSKGVALGGTIGSPTITVTPGSVAENNDSIVTGGIVHQAIKDILIDYRTTSNTFTQKNTFSYSGAVDATSEATNATINISTGGLVAASGIRAAKIYNSVWNDLVDCIPVDNRCILEYGYCYCFDGERYYKSNRYAERGIIGIHSDTAGFEMGHKSNTDELHCAVAGFCLAYVDKEYAPGTPLTCGKNGTLTRMRLIDRIIHPERIVATYWKNEDSELWGPPSDKIKVNGRKWVKVI